MSSLRHCQKSFHSSQFSASCSPSPHQLLPDSPPPKLFATFCQWLVSYSPSPPPRPHLPPPGQHLPFPPPPFATSSPCPYLGVGLGVRTMLKQSNFKSCPHPCLCFSWHPYPPPLMLPSSWVEACLDLLNKTKQ